MVDCNEKVIRVGSRKSELALIQTKHVINQLQILFPMKRFEIHTMSTIGDRILNISLPKIGEKSLFTRDLEDALKNGRVDFIVHSLKDLPTSLPDGMTIGAVLEREDCRDALVLNTSFTGYTLQNLPRGSVIGTSSLRRAAQIRRKYPQLNLCDIRGNLNTRLAKLDGASSKFSGILLAQAGLSRMGWKDRISQVLEPEDILYCVGQGALAVECRTNDEEILSMLKHIMCFKTTCKILAERSFLKTLGGGCSAPVAVSCKFNENFKKKNLNQESILQLHGAVWSLDGKEEVKGHVECSLGSLKRRKTEEFSATEDEEDDENVIPFKQSRLDINNQEDNAKIINDDPNIDGADLSNLKYLVDLHGRLFQQCPYYQQHKNDQENGTLSTKKEICPHTLPIGQDFMGKCPYIEDTTQKVELAEKGLNQISNSNVVDSAKIENNQEKIEDGCENKSSQNSSIKISEKGSCPYHKNKLNDEKQFPSDTTNISSPKNKRDEDVLNSTQINSSKTQNPENKNLANEQMTNNFELGHSSCTYLQKIQQIDHPDHNASNEILKSPIPHNFCEENKNIFCGIFRHKCFDKFIFKKCDDLGRQLAQNLIKEGALNIMKKAQDEIHHGNEN